MTGIKIGIQVGCRVGTEKGYQVGIKVVKIKSLRSNPAPIVNHI